MRDARENIEEDTRTRCFICNIDNNKFDRRVEGGFDEHIKRQHNMWEYLYFMHHLQRKPKDEFTGQESYVWEKMMRRDVSFFPLNKSLAYEKAVRDDKAGEMEKMDHTTTSQQQVTPGFATK